MTGMAPYVCPCLTCPKCGRAKDVRDYDHPEDGLAECASCHHEWWATVGPFMDGRHIMSDAQEAEWRRSDDDQMGLNAS